MPFPQGNIVTVDDLQAGDILISFDEDDPEHSMLWVGGPKPVAHSSDSNETSGIVRQSTKVLNLGDGEPGIAVYRPTNGVMAQKAAQIGTAFSIPTDDSRYVFARQQQMYVNLSTRFSQDRLGGNGGVWGQEAIVRAVRAYARFSRGEALSAGEGVTCTQFVTYTYQAAAIAWLIARDRHAAVVIQHACNDRSPSQLGLHATTQMQPGTARNLAFGADVARVGARYSAIQPIRNALDMAIPTSMKVNASITSVDVLVQRLPGDARFMHAGNLRCKHGSDSD